MHDRLRPQPNAAAVQANIVIGVAGARRNAAIAVVADGEIQIASEQERFTRARGAGYANGRTGEVMQQMLRLANLEGRVVSAYACAEEGFAFDPSVPHVQWPHAYGHACTAFLQSPFDSAAILVCDSGSQPEVTVWRGRGAEVTRVEWDWSGPGFTRLFGLATAACGFAPGRDEHRLEGLARAGGTCPQQMPAILVSCVGDRLRVDDAFMQKVAAGARAARQQGVNAFARFAHGVQQQIAEALLALVKEVRRLVDEENICLGGGLFYNTHLNTSVAARGPFANCFVPPNPGNPGLAIGTALAAAGQSPRLLRPREIAFLGPAYDDADVKAFLDNCKLTYDYVNDGQLVATVADAIARGLLVGWFQGRMECGPRALGHRSILANPLSPHVLANLNAYLKQGDDYRTYGVMLRQSDAETYLHTSRQSRFMEFEAEFQDSAAFRPLLPYSAKQVRYQTITPEQARLSRLLEAVGERTGCPVVINTSLNGFHEPIACSPRDAIRIFYGTGLDMLVLGNFVLRK